MCPVWRSWRLIEGLQAAQEDGPLSPLGIGLEAASRDAPGPSASSAVRAKVIFEPVRPYSGASRDRAQRGAWLRRGRRTGVAQVA